MKVIDLLADDVFDVTPFANGVFFLRQPDESTRLSCSGPHEYTKIPINPKR